MNAKFIIFYHFFLTIYGIALIDYYLVLPGIYFHMQMYYLCSYNTWYDKLYQNLPKTPHNKNI